MATGQPKAVVFVIAMLVGMWIFEAAERRTSSRHTQQNRR
jgi:hypothetical protein